MAELYCYVIIFFTKAMLKSGWGFHNFLNWWNIWFNWWKNHSN